MAYYVYITTNKINGMKYIGQHSGEIDDNYLGSGVKLKNAIKKYGKENFFKEILYIASSEKELNEKEKEFISKYNAVNDSEFYNIAPGGEGYNVKDLSEENYKIWYAKCLEGNQKRDTSYMQTAEYKEKMSKSTSGEKNGMYGKHHTEEAKKKMSENSIGKTLGSKNGMYGKKGMNAINGRHIKMFDKDHNLIKEFP